MNRFAMTVLGVMFWYNAASPDLVLPTLFPPVHDHGF
jgi:hypothetical protein